MALKLKKAQEALALKREKERIELERLVKEKREAEASKKKPLQKVDTEKEKKEEPTKEVSETQETPMIEEKPPVEIPNVDTKDQKVENIATKKIEIRDLFIIPPDFYGVDTQGEEDMKGVTIKDVEKKKPKFAPNIKDKGDKKRKREKTSEDETETSESSDSEEERRKERKRHKKRKLQLPTKPTSAPQSGTLPSKSWFDTIGGAFTKVSPYLPPIDGTSIRNNAILGLASIFVIWARGKLSRHLIGGPVVGTLHQNIPISVDTVQKANAVMPIPPNPLMNNIYDMSRYAR